jgi:cell division protein FtsQ
VSAIASALSRPLSGLAALAPSPRLRRRLIAIVAACVVLAAAYMFWFRDSGIVKVDRVTVTGVTTRDSARLREALARAGRSMTTLHVDRERLERAVAGYPVVRELKVRPDFPSSLTIEVVEHHPAAIAIAGSLRVPVAGDGTVLRGLPIEGELPELHLRGALPPRRLHEADALRAAHVLGGAPAPLRSRLLGVREGGDKGLTVKMREGPDLVFGDATRLRAKWIAATRVLADPSARGATYIDLRLPGRPAAGGVAAETLQPVAPEAAPADAAAPPPTATPTTPAVTAPPTSQAPAQQAPSPTPVQPQAGAGGGATANPQP